MVTKKYNKTFDRSIRNEFVHLSILANFVVLFSEVSRSNQGQGGGRVSILHLILGWTNLFRKSG